eukprot:TRINITY_DN85869_c0_g1_i1.p1 TRINITY_DN85869_c0_g1~~TRINITY_DN85869_c0_g1_i1.p1  ORF type:complete len:367 (-),score=34.91 TRINITY_DN85869_c0_g1_i1:102-1154(-)
MAAVNKFAQFANKLSVHPFPRARTPLVYSNPLSKICSADVWLKMDALRPCGSFKDRGIGYLMQSKANELQKQGRDIHFISSSGGNAGFAAAICGRQLNSKVTVVVPTITKPLMREKIAAAGAEVIVHGENWNAADEYTQSLVQSKGYIYVHPFDDPLIWFGHSGLVHEVREQLTPEGTIPDLIVCVVGGGGLLNGILTGVEDCGWKDHTVVASAETIGCDSLTQALKAKSLVRLPGITSIATSLGARQVAAGVLEKALDHDVVPLTVTDKQAVRACTALLDDERVLVEPACGAGLALLYENEKREELFSAVLERKKNMGSGRDRLCVVVEVCGGQIISAELLKEFERVTA